MERAFPPPGGHVRQESAGRGKKGGFIRQALRLPAGYGRHIRLAFQILDRIRNFMMRCCPLPCSPGVLPVRQAEEAQAAVRRRMIIPHVQITSSGVQSTLSALESI